MPEFICSDLVLDAWESSYVNSEDAVWRSGVSVSQQERQGILVQHMEILSHEAAITLCKPIGRYITLQFPSLQRRFQAEFISGANLVAQALRELLNRILPSPKGVQAGTFSALVACLGNAAITPDALGPLCAKDLLITGHLKSADPELFTDFSNLSVITPGVLSATGIESATLIASAVQAVHPDVVIAVDAMAARTLSRLCTTVQLCDTGLAPGAGIGNHRQILNRETLGVPVIGMGIPTVVNAAALVRDLAGECPADSLPQCKSMFVAPREIDILVADGAKLLAYGINCAIHPQLSPEDIACFLS